MATGLARTLSKLGYCSRSQAVELIVAGRVMLNGRVCRDAERPALMDRDNIAVDGRPVAAAAKVYLMLNKPRGLVTTTEDEQRRATVYECLKNAPSGHLAPVGRLDKASEGLLLFSNDNAWAEGITGPANPVLKTYHVQVNRLLGEEDLQRLREGAKVDGAHLRARSVERLRAGRRNCWLQVVLDEGRNRHIRRLLEAHGLETLRLVRVAIGDLVLGNLQKGEWRLLTAEEVRRLAARA